MTEKRGSLGDGYFAATYGWYIGGDTSWEVPCPWWRPPAIDAVAALLFPGMQVLEWGAGGSTVWLAAQGCRVRALELDASWAAAVQQRLLASPWPGLVLSFPPADLAAYADYILNFPPESFDLVIVDGRARARCLGHAQDRVKVGGYVLLDNSERAEYAAGVDLYRDWPRWDWGDDGWLTTLWQRPAGWVAPREVVHLPAEEA